MRRQKSENLTVTVKLKGKKVIDQEKKKSKWTNQVAQENKGN